MTLKNIINDESGKTAFICGLGPSLSDSIEYITKNRNEIVLISCNDIDLNTNLNPDYWMFANSVQTFPFMLDRFKKYKDATIVHSDSVDATPKEWIEQNCSGLKYVSYDQRHFNNSKCNNCPNRCQNFINGRLTIQEELQNFTNYNLRYSPGDTVAIHMLALSILLGCKKIYISGVDLDYKKGYFNTHRTPMLVTEFDPFLNNILDDFHIINESAKNIGVEIINLSQSSHLSKVLKTETI
jgi:hypothetical protein